MNTRKCPRCGETKPLEAFHRNSADPLGRSVYCKPCANESRREWRAANADRDRQTHRRYREKHKAARAELNRRWREQNAERWRAYMRQYYLDNQERLRENQRQDYQRNRERYVAHATKRRAKAEIGLTQNDKDYMEVLRQDPCAYCGEVGGVVDHIDALSKAGTADWTNLTAACRSCNARKYTMSLLEFLERSQPNQRQGASTAA